MPISRFYYREEDRWQAGQLAIRFESGIGIERERILDGEITLTAPRYRNLGIGGVEMPPMR